MGKPYHIWYLILNQSKWLMWNCFRQKVHTTCVKTTVLLFNWFFSNEDFCIYLELSWIVAMIVLESTILNSISNLPRQLFLIAETKKKVYK